MFFLFVLQTFWFDGAQLCNPHFFSSLPLSTGPTAVIFPARDNKVSDGVCLEVLDQGGVEVTCCDVVEVLCEAGVY